MRGPDSGARGTTSHRPAATTPGSGGTRRRAGRRPSRAGSSPTARKGRPAGRSPPLTGTSRAVLSTRTASRAGPAALSPLPVRASRAGAPAVRSQLRPVAGSPTCPDTVRAPRPAVCRAIRDRERFLRRPTPSRRRGRTSPPVPTMRPGLDTRARNGPPHRPEERRRRAPSRRTRWPRPSCRGRPCPPRRPSSLRRLPNNPSLLSGPSNPSNPSNPSSTVLRRVRRNSGHRGSRRSHSSRRHGGHSRPRPRLRTGTRRPRLPCLPSRHRHLPRTRHPLRGRGRRATRSRLAGGSSRGTDRRADRKRRGSGTRLPAPAPGRRSRPPAPGSVAPLPPRRRVRQCLRAEPASPGGSVRRARRTP